MNLNQVGKSMIIQLQKILSKAENNDLESAMELWDGWASVRYRDLKYFNPGSHRL